MNNNKDLNSNSSMSQEPVRKNSSEFEGNKKQLLLLLKNVREVYESATLNVSPKYWRLTNTHMLDLDQMIKEVDSFEEVQEEELSDPWIREQMTKKP